jgi:flavodoxin
MKNLIIFYSFDGNTKHIADAISEEIKADLLELKPKKDLKKGFTKYFWGGRQVMMGIKPELEPFSVDAQDYDMIFIGTPVWAFSYAPALRTFFSQNILFGKKIALFCCHGGNPGKTFSNIKKELERKDPSQKNVFLGEADFKEPLHNDKEGAVKRAKVWARNIVGNI